MKKSGTELIGKLSRAEIELEFERIYNVIFPSQIDLLTKISAIGSVDRPFVENHYAIVKRNNPILISENWDINQYLAYLLFTSKVLEVNGDRFFITQKGKVFLSYLAIMNYKKMGTL